MKSLPNELREQVTLGAPHTGELEFLPSVSKGNYPTEALVATEAKPGNIAMIAWLREEIPASNCMYGAVPWP